MPWYFYFKIVLEKGIPPLSIVFLGGFIIFVWRYPKHIITTAALSFLLVHILVGHKEMRFLIFIYQMTPIFMIYIYRPQWWSKYFWGINCVALVITSFSPLTSYLSFQRWLYKRYPHAVTINVEKETNGRHLHLSPPYKHPLTRLQPVSELKNATGTVLTSKIRQFKTMRTRRNCRLIRSHYPAWLLQEKYNFFDWNTRSSIYVLWECSP